MGLSCSAMRCRRCSAAWATRSASSTTGNPTSSASTPTGAVNHYLATHYQAVAALCGLYQTGVVVVGFDADGEACIAEPFLENGMGKVGDEYFSHGDRI